jgi:hypothetical protein
MYAKTAEGAVGVVSEDARTKGHSASQVQLRLADGQETDGIKVDALTEASEAEIADYDAEFKRRFPFIDLERYPEKLGKYWLGPIDPTRSHDEPQGGYGLVKAGINSETGERVCCKLSHLKYEGTEAQRMEIIMHANLKHENVVDLKDIVFEKPAGRPKKQRYKAG